MVAAAAAYLVIWWLLPQDEGPRAPLTVGSYLGFLAILIGLGWFVRPPAHSSLVRDDPFYRLPRAARIGVMTVFLAPVGYALIQGARTGTLPVFPRWVNGLWWVGIGLVYIAAVKRAGSVPEAIIRRELRIRRRMAGSFFCGMLAVVFAIRTGRALMWYGDEFIFDAALTALFVTVALRLRPKRDDYPAMA
jgi:hypothetical protein